jgi:hypothetical protein
MSWRWARSDDDMSRNWYTRGRCTKITEIGPCTCIHDRMKSSRNRLFFFSLYELVTQIDEKLKLLSETRLLQRDLFRRPRLAQGLNQANCTICRRQQITCRLVVRYVIRALACGTPTLGP